MNLLHIDSSISGKQSVSRQLTTSIVAHLKHATPALEITYRDLVAAPVPQHTPSLWERRLQAVYEDKPLNTQAIPPQGTFAPDDHSEIVQLEQDFAAINAVLREFLAADIVVLGAPMYNFAIPSQLKAWIDLTSGLPLHTLLPMAEHTKMGMQIVWLSCLTQGQLKSHRLLRSISVSRATLTQQPSGGA